MSEFARLNWHVGGDHATLLSGQITVCLGLECLCVAAGGLCSVSGRDQRGSTWKYFCGVRGQSYWTWVTTSMCKQETPSVMRETLSSQEQRRCGRSSPHYSVGLLAFTIKIQTQTRDFFTTLPKKLQCSRINTWCSKGENTCFVCLAVVVFGPSVCVWQCVCVCVARCIPVFVWTALTTN